MTDIDMSQFNRGAHAFVEDVESEILELRHSIADDVKDEAERISPRRSGKFAGAWEKNKSRKPYGVDIVGNDTFYGHFLDSGTVKQRPLRIRERAAAKAVAKHGGGIE